MFYTYWQLRNHNGIIPFCNDQTKGRALSFLGVRFWLFNGHLKEYITATNIKTMITQLAFSSFNTKWQFVFFLNKPRRRIGKAITPDVLWLTINGPSNSEVEMIYEAIKCKTVTHKCSYRLTQLMEYYTPCRLIDPKKSLNVVSSVLLAFKRLMQSSFENHYILT